MKLIKNFKNDIEDDSIFLLAVLRDENLLIEYFIKYYKKIGITHFIFLDNGSKDGCFEYLKELDENILLYSTNKSYKNASYGTDWINLLLEKYCKNHWCLILDIDELIYVYNINTLIENMKKKNATVCRFLLLDMYSKTKKIYIRGEDFMNHSDHFDSNLKHYEIYNRGLFNLHIKGGVRKRISNCSPCIIKRSLFYYDFSSQYCIGHGYHYLISKETKKILEKSDIKLYPYLEYLLHYKFIKPDFTEFVKKRIANNQDWNNSSEYKLFSKKLVNKKQLDKIFRQLFLR